MSSSRPKSSNSDTLSLKKDELQGSQVERQPPIKSLRKPSGLLPPKTKVPKSIEGSRVSVESDVRMKDDTLSSSSQSQRPASRSQESKRLRTSSVISYSSNQKRVLENQFNTKKVRFIKMKREIEDKQRCSEAAYEELYQLREKIITNGGKDPGKIEDLFGDRFALRGRSGDEAYAEVGADDKDLSQLNLKQFSESALGFCKEVIDKRCETTEWMIELERKIDDYPVDSIKEELSHHLEQFRVDTAEYQERLAEMQKDHHHQVSDLMQRIGCLVQEVKILKQKQAEMVREGAGGSGEISAVDVETFEKVSEELKSEKEKLMKARSKIRDQKNAIAQWEEKLQLEMERTRKLENQLKQKESLYGQKTKELNKTVINKLEKQKETVEARVSKLKEELEFKETENKTMLSEYTKQLEEITQKLEAEKKAKKELEANMEDVMVRYTKLEEKCQQLLEMNEDKRKEAISDEKHTENEVQLFNELKEAQRQLAEKEEQVKRLEIEREEIIVAVNEADQENDTSSKKLTADLIKRSNELHVLKGQFAQLQKNYKKQQHRSDQLEHKLEDMTRLQAQMKDGTRASYGAQILQLQQQVSDLRSSLTDSSSQISDLEKTIIQLQLKNEHYKRYIRELGKDLNVKKEMYQILGNKNVEELIDPKKLTIINDEFEKLYGMVENKESQIKKLEKIIGQMEKHEEYSQAQRTRMEQRIAKLETALKEGQQAHRNRGFSFL